MSEFDWQGLYDMLAALAKRDLLYITVKGDPELKRVSSWKANGIQFDGNHLQIVCDMDRYRREAEIDRQVREAGEGDE